MFYVIQGVLEEVRNGFSVDVVIADPDINRRFVDLCARGLSKSPYELNRSLLNARKSGKLGALNLAKTPD